MKVYDIFYKFSYINFHIYLKEISYSNIIKIVFLVVFNDFFSFYVKSSYFVNNIWLLKKIEIITNGSRRWLSSSIVLGCLNDVSERYLTPNNISNIMHYFFQVSNIFYGVSSDNIFVQNGLNYCTNIARFLCIVFDRN